MTDYYTKLPPSAIESEISLLGSMMINPLCIDDVIMVLSGPEDFSDPKHGCIYEHMLRLYDGRGTLDIVQLEQQVDDAKAMEDVGGRAYLSQLVQAVPSASNAVHYAREVREKAVLRQLISLAGDTLRDCHEKPGEVRSVLEEAESRLYAIAHRSEQNSSISMMSLIPACMDHLTGEAQQGIKTGFHELDHMTGGMRPGDLIIIAARPSMGKTALGLGIAARCSSMGNSVGFFSLEMDRHELGFRLISSAGQIPSSKIRRGGLESREDCDAAISAADRAMALNLYIDDTPGLTLLQLRSKARRMKSKHGIKLLLLDYIQLMRAGGKVESRRVEVGEISRGIKQLARELQIPIIALSQLNRLAESRADNRPKMSDLRESGDLEQDADAVWLLHRDHYYDKAADPNLADLLIAKNRQGPTGSIELHWAGEYMKFSNWRPQS